MDRAKHDGSITPMVGGYHVIINRDTGIDFHSTYIFLEICFTWFSVNAHTIDATVCAHVHVYVHTPEENFSSEITKKLINHLRL